MPRPRPLRRLLALAVPLALLAACAEPTTPTPETTARLPAGEQILLGASLFSVDAGSGFYLLDPTTGTLAAWELQGGRGLVEDGSSCLGGNDHLRWDAGRRELLLSGQLGCTDGLYRIGADGAVSDVSLPALPAAVEYPAQATLAPAGDRVALVGTVFERQGVSEAHLYVGAPGAQALPLGEGMGFEHIDHVRWAPNGEALAFTAGTRPGGVYYRRAYLADLAGGEVRALSEAEALIDTTPAFAPDGAVVFVAAAAEGSPPALYRALPGEDAVPVVALGDLPGADLWRGAFTLSPNGRQAALSGGRASASTPETVYLADLEAGSVRDLLPAELPVERSGSGNEAEPPHVEPLAWSPDGSQLLVRSDIAGYCRTLGLSGMVGCTDQLYTVPAEGGAPRRLSEAHVDGISFALWLR